jgi:hypothetical protein
MSLQGIIASNYHNRFPRKVELRASRNPPHGSDPGDLSTET